MKGKMFARLQQAYVHTSWVVKGTCKKSSAEESSAHLLGWGRGRGLFGLCERHEMAEAGGCALASS